MHQLCRILAHVVNCFDNASFSYMILSRMGMSLFFMLVLMPVTKWILYEKLFVDRGYISTKIFDMLFEGGILGRIAYTFEVLSSTLAPVK